MATTSRGAGPVTEACSPAGLSVRAAGIRKTYGTTIAALDGVDLTVEAGELLALLGPSGSGKTTLLRVIAGLEVPDQGRVHFGEDDVTELPVQDRHIGFVFQHYALFRHMTVFDNIAYGLRARRGSRPGRAAIRQRVAELLALVQMTGVESRYPAQLSGGQRQRVALARALAASPRVLLLDEPFGALDARVRKDLRRWLREIHRETGQTTIFVTHDQDEALELADRVAILDGGRIRQVGPPEEVHDRPASAFVASFVGDRVRLPVTVAGGQVRLGLSALSISASGVPDGEAVLFIRSDELSLSAPGQGGVPGTVLEARRIGARRTATVRLRDAPLDLDVEVRGPAPEAGARVSLALSGGLVFPPV